MKVGCKGRRVLKGEYENSGCVSEKDEERGKVNHKRTLRNVIT